jgi:hypothetical protein
MTLMGDGLSDIHPLPSPLSTHPNGHDESVSETDMEF